MGELDKTARRNGQSNALRWLGLTQIYRSVLGHPLENYSRIKVHYLVSIACISVLARQVDASGLLSYILVFLRSQKNRFVSQTSIGGTLRHVLATIEQNLG